MWLFGMKLQSRTYSICPTELSPSALELWMSSVTSCGLVLSSILLLLMMTFCPRISMVWLSFASSVKFCKWSKLEHRANSLDLIWNSLDSRLQLPLHWRVHPPASPQLAQAPAEPFDGAPCADVDVALSDSSGRTLVYIRHKHATERCTLHLGDACCAAASRVSQQILSDNADRSVF